MTTELDEHSQHLLRDLAPQVLGIVARRYRDFAAAEDAVQEALIAAALQWPQTGVPENPRGWLIRVASRRMLDAIRSEIARREREQEVALDALRQDATDVDPDDTLTLFFLCCHPSLTPASAIALTLRAVGGLTTAQIAHAFLVPEATMAQRISRAKAAIKTAGSRFHMPEGREQSERLAAVLHILYLIFNEGYVASAGESAQRIELSQEAIRLTRSLHALMPENPEVEGLLALMVLTHARREARTGPGGELIPLDRQDRTLWKQPEIAEGAALLQKAISRGAVGAYQLQAAIAALHDEAQRAEDTDWPQILALYELMKRISDNPMVALNHAIAAAMVYGLTKGLELLRALDADERIARHHRLDAARAHLLEMAGDYKAAIAHYHMAATRTTSLPEQQYLQTQAARLCERL
ncbi:sigma-70 family RNA polymerase sigma factor [Terriglobus albidus]|uniref:Sigma-70 family RNA polymerase sigma factor n=1 Tax=Terriglobus albidus TaxID=1592106 RepID=A0A5B9EFY2_9BACT|nr:sigma-70 family RNA polymerase sigma factor [Terriglobus albidus]